MSIQVCVDILKTDLFLELLKEPSRFRKQIHGDAQVAIDVKGSRQVKNIQLRAIETFCQDNFPRKSIIVCNEKNKRKVGEIYITPWKEFLQEFWPGNIVC